MITIDNKLLITKEINTILVDYAQKIVLRRLFIALSFESTENGKMITDLIQSLNFYGIGATPIELDFELMNLISGFIQNIKKEERTSLYFWVLDQKYLHYLVSFEYDDDTHAESEFDKRFGRELAYKIYEPNDSDLMQDTMDELKNYLVDFATELDLSVIDEYTSERILEEIDNYCS